jgi:hypothetical protein
VSSGVRVERGSGRAVFRRRGFRVELCFDGRGFRVELCFDGRGFRVELCFDGRGFRVERVSIRRESKITTTSNRNEIWEEPESGFGAPADDQINRERKTQAKSGIPFGGW